MAQATGMSGALSAIYDTWPSADAARARLVAAGVAAEDVKVIPETPDVQAEGRDVGTEGGFVGALFSLFFPREDRDLHEEALRRGGVLVVAERVPAGLHDAALAALDQDGPIDLEERRDSWRGEGWDAPAASPPEGQALRHDPTTGRRGVRSYRPD